MIFKRRFVLERKASPDCFVEMKSLLLTTNDEVICGDNMKDATVSSMDGLQIIRRFVMLAIQKRLFKLLPTSLDRDSLGGREMLGDEGTLDWSLIMM